MSKLIKRRSFLGGKAPLEGTELPAERSATSPRSPRSPRSPETKDAAQIRKQATVDMNRLVERQKKSYLKEGAFFLRYYDHNKTIKTASTYMRLSKDGKALEWADAAKGADMSGVQLDQRIPLKEIKALVTGKKMGIWSRVKRSDEVIARSFSLVLRSIEPGQLDLTAPDVDFFVGWTDGIMATLKGKSKDADDDPMRPKVDDPRTLAELQALIDLETAVRCLPKLSVPVPKPPPIPPAPANMTFQSHAGYKPPIA